MNIELLDNNFLILTKIAKHFRLSYSTIKKKIQNDDPTVLEYIYQTEKDYKSKKEAAKKFPLFFK